MSAKAAFILDLKKADPDVDHDGIEIAWKQELELRAAEREDKRLAAEAEREEKRLAAEAEREEKRLAAEAEREEKRLAAEAEREEKRLAAERKYELAKLSMTQQRGDMFVPTVSLSEFILGSHFYSLLVSSPIRTEKRKLV
jgi:cell division septum initiation protein DivIVA